MAIEVNTMTEKIYLEDGTLTSYLSKVTELGYDSSPWIALEQTIFHPQGGGQKADIGKINEVSVTHVVHEETGIVKHYVSDIYAFSINQLVALSINKEYRLENSKLHTAGHLIAAILENKFSLQAISGHHWPREARIEFVGKDVKEIEEVKKILQVEIDFCKKDNPPVLILRNSSSNRKIQIGSFNPVSCGGTHVSQISDLGNVKISSLKNKGEKLRVSYYVEA